MATAAARGAAGIREDAADKGRVEGMDHWRRRRPEKQGPYGDEAPAFGAKAAKDAGIPNQWCR